MRILEIGTSNADQIRNMENVNLADMLKLVIRNYTANAVNVAEQSHQRQLLQLESKRKTAIEELRPPRELANLTQFSQKILETKVERKMKTKPLAKQQLFCLNDLQKKLSKELKAFDLKVSAPVLPLHHKNHNGDDDEEEEEDQSEEDRYQHDGETTDDELDDSEDDDDEEDNEIDNANEENTDHEDDSLCSQENTDECCR